MVFISDKSILLSEIIYVALSDIILLTCKVFLDLSCQASYTIMREVLYC